MYALVVAASLITGDPMVESFQLGTVTNRWSVLPDSTPVMVNVPIQQEPQLSLIMIHDAVLPVTHPWFVEAPKPEFIPPPWRQTHTPLPLFDGMALDPLPTGFYQGTVDVRLPDHVTVENPTSVLPPPPVQWWPLP